MYWYTNDMEIIYLYKKSRKYIENFPQKNEITETSHVNLDW